MLRPFAGTKHQLLIPAAALGGGIFLVTCDVLARLIPSRSEIPLGVVTGLIGAPLFLLLLLRLRREQAYA
jgi:iron complex transport system permease protein